MPLPPALAARLAKRGIIPKEAAEKQKSRDADEEVFAESYDDGHESRDHGRNAEKPIDERIKFMGYPGCPNKWNVYHECVLWCQNTWGSGKTEVDDPNYLAKYKAMMAQYEPLPDEWKEQFDPGTGRHFFWCTRTDRVSWLPPGHPKAKITDAASHVREMLQNQLAADDDDDDEEEHAMDLDSDMESDDDAEEERETRDKRDREHDRYHHRSSRSRGRGESDKVDPMDPSSYSDAPRGSWSSGLEKRE